MSDLIIGNDPIDVSKEKISDLIYEYIDYMYCDNCRFSIELMEESESACWDCHRKNNGWGISRRTADAISEKILKLLEAEDERRKDGTKVDDYKKSMSSFNGIKGGTVSE